MSLKPVAAEIDLEVRLRELKLEEPRVTPEMVDSMIAERTFTLLPCKKAMICTMTLTNGFKLFGKNATVSPGNFNLALAEELSYKDAREQLWPFAGFLLAEDLFRGNAPLTPEQRELPDHVQRVIREMYSTGSKLLGLTEFLAAYFAEPEKFGDIPLIEINDLKEQKEHMTKYVAVLQRRLERAGV